MGDRGFTVFIAVPSYPNPLEVSGCQGRRHAGRLVGVSRELHAGTLISWPESLVSGQA